VEVVLLIWSSGLDSVLQFSVALVVAVAWTWEELGVIPEHKDGKGDSYTFMLHPVYTLSKGPISTLTGVSQSWKSREM
jgi:hypothetical protein